MNLNDYITENQIDRIIYTIRTVCMKYKSIDIQLQNLFYEPYTNMRKKHSITSAIISAFSPKACDIPGLHSTDLCYGLNNMLSQPELISNNAVIQFYVRVGLI